eukprot:1769652-Prorocentrum_lima.AAC.1
MTSSLVGSEMCIRDSNQNNRPIKLWERIRTTAVLPRLDKCECGTDSIQPVSYTHLTLPTICSV